MEKILKRASNVSFPTKIAEQAVLGFDAYIDNVTSVVKVRYSPSDYEIMENMTEWAERISQSSGSSSSMERIIKRVSVGGFTCNVGKALSTLCGLNQNINLIGAFGLANLLQIFQEQLIDIYHCLLFPIGNPGVTDAYEFVDGKIMMCNFENINRLDWDQILSNAGEQLLIEKFDSSELWGIGYWSSSPHMSKIYSSLQESILPSLTYSARNKHLVLDLSDLKKKPQNQIMELVAILPRFEDYVQVVLLLNDRELEDLATALGEDESVDTLFLTQKIQEKLNLSFVISHGPKNAAIASEKIQNLVLNAYTSSPKFTTSAGDHFTAGISYALLIKSPIEILPLLGSCVSSFFVRTGESPTPQDLKQFLTHYPEYLERDIETIIL